MEPNNKKINIGIVRIDNISHAKDIVAMNEYMFYVTIMQIHEDDYEWEVPRKNEKQ